MEHICGKWSGRKSRRKGRIGERVCNICRKFVFRNLLDYIFTYGDNPYHSRNLPAFLERNASLLERSDPSQGHHPLPDKDLGTTGVPHSPSLQTDRGVTPPPCPHWHGPEPRHPRPPSPHGPRHLFSFYLVNLMRPLYRGLGLVVSVCLGPYRTSPTHLLTPWVLQVEDKGCEKRWSMSLFVYLSERYTP